MTLVTSLRASKDILFQPHYNKDLCFWNCGIKIIIYFLVMLSSPTINIEIKTYHCHEPSDNIRSGVGTISCSK